MIAVETPVFSRKLNCYHLNVLALTSINEGPPVSIIEAMASGIPVISTDAGGVRELIAGMFSSRQALCGMGNGESRMRNADTKQSLR